MCSPWVNMYSPSKFIYSPWANKDFLTGTLKRCHDIGHFGRKPVKYDGRMTESEQPCGNTIFLNFRELE